jgi:hypothetical protein
LEQPLFINIKNNNPHNAMLTKGMINTPANKGTTENKANSGIKKNIIAVGISLDALRGVPGFSGSGKSPHLLTCPVSLLAGRGLVGKIAGFVKALALIDDTVMIEIKQQQQQQVQAPQVGVASEILLFSLSNWVTSLIMVFSP